MRKLLIATLLICGFSLSASADRSARKLIPVEQYYITGYPLYGAAVTPDDNADLAEPGVIRVNANGAVKATCYGSTTAITLTMVAGEFFPCLVKRVYDTDTDAITIHVFF